MFKRLRAAASAAKRGLGLSSSRYTFDDASELARLYSVFDALDGHLRKFAALAGAFVEAAEALRASVERVTDETLGLCSTLAALDEADEGVRKLESTALNTRFAVGDTMPEHQLVSDLEIGALAWVDARLASFQAIRERLDRREELLRSARSSAAQVDALRADQSSAGQQALFKAEDQLAQISAELGVLGAALTSDLEVVYRERGELARLAFTAMRKCQRRYLLQASLALGDDSGPGAELGGEPSAETVDEGNARVCWARDEQTSDAVQQLPVEPEGDQVQDQQWEAADGAVQDREQLVDLVRSFRDSHKRRLFERPPEHVGLVDHVAEDAQIRSARHTGMYVLRGGAPRVALPHGGDPNRAAAAATVMQRFFRRCRAHSELRGRANGRYAVDTDTAGRVFYYDRCTGESSYERPWTLGWTEDTSEPQGLFQQQQRRQQQQQQQQQQQSYGS